VSLLPPPWPEYYPSRVEVKSPWYPWYPP